MIGIASPLIAQLACLNCLFDRRTGAILERAREYTTDIGQGRENALIGRPEVAKQAKSANDGNDEI